MSLSKTFIPDAQTAVAYLTRCANKTAALKAINPAGADTTYGRTLTRVARLYAGAIEEIQTAGKVTAEVAFLVENVRDAKTHPLPMEIGAEIDAAAARIVERNHVVRHEAAAAAFTIPTETTTMPTPKVNTDPFKLAATKVAAAETLAGKPAYTAALAEAREAVAAAAKLLPAAVVNTDHAKLKNATGSDALARYAAGIKLPTGNAHVVAKAPEGKTPDEKTRLKLAMGNANLAAYAASIKLPGNK